MRRAPRIPPVEVVDDAQRDALGKTRQGRDGRPLNVFRTLAHRPKLLRRVNSLGGYFAVHGSLPVREREIVSLRTASRVGSAYELAHHRRQAAEAGLREEEIDAAIDATIAHAWSPGDRALLELVDELIAHHTVSDAAWNALAEPFGDDGRLELLVLIGFYRLIGGVANAIEVQIDG